MGEPGLMIIRTTHRTPQAQWSIARAIPDARLAGLVTAFWELDGEEEPLAELELPSGQISVTFSLVGRHFATDPFDGVVAFTEAWATGLRTTPLPTLGCGRAWLCGVRMSPVGAARLFGDQFSNLTHRIVDLESILGSATAALLQRLRRASGAEARFEHIAKFLAERFSGRDGFAPEVAAAAHLLERSGGRRPIAGVAHAVGWRRERLHRDFAAQVGLSPKVFARTVRFRDALSRVATRTATPLTVIAHESGYADQAHFNRDFRVFTGVTPSAYRDRLGLSPAHDLIPMDAHIRSSVGWRPMSG